MKRPTFFISSTIYDFFDLRSSIKYFLEEQGCKVLTSESNDFNKSLNTHSYNACLETICQADYFILLIGSRVGGWYDKEKKISITQKEYQEAYRLHIEGELKVINFVRSDIWNLRTDRHELSKYLSKLDIDSKKTSEIANHPTQKISDPEFIINFINEIGRNKETKEALDGEREFPSGNWIHTFSTFRDIADTLKPEIFHGIPIDQAIMRKLLLSELRDLLRKNLIKSNENIFSPQATIQNFYTQHKLDSNFSLTGYTFVKKKTWELFKFFMLIYTGRSYNIQIVPKALSSSTFLEFNNKSGIFEETAVHQSLTTLYKEINLHFDGLISNKDDFLQRYPANSTPSTNGEVKVANIDLISILHALQRWSNVITISKSIINYLEGDIFVSPQIFKQSPIPSENILFEKETVTSEELNLFIKE